jgi:hypothetical protein
MIHGLEDPKNGLDNIMAKLRNAHKFDFMIKNMRKIKILSFSTFKKIGIL